MIVWDIVSCFLDNTETEIEATPTEDSICVEALKKANCMHCFARARSEWLKEIKCDIAYRKDWKVLEKTDTILTVANQQGYDVPVDCLKVLEVFIAKTPLSLLPYEYIDNEPTDIGRPNSVGQYGQQLFFDPVPDGEYTVSIRYIFNPSKSLDTVRLEKVYSLWRPTLIAGVFMRALQEKIVGDILDSGQKTQYGYSDALQNYERAIQRLMLLDGRERTQRTSIGFQSIGGLPKR